FTTLNDVTVICKRSGKVNGIGAWFMTYSDGTDFEIDIASCLIDIIECDPSTVRFTCENEICPIVSAEEISCPSGTILKDADGITLRGVTCDEQTGFYKHLTSEVHCEEPIATTTD
ncbi:hypothetical protein PFISCL1PPCAC_25449, partial [Pristionchus fissidentatus]